MSAVIDHGQFFLVFGTDRAGRHISGSAQTAVKHYGAQPGQPEGLQGRSYAIPVRDERGQCLPLRSIAISIQRFLQFAEGSPENFMVTHLTLQDDSLISPRQAARLFANRTPNVWLSRKWERLCHPEEPLEFRLLVYVHQLPTNLSLIHEKLTHWLLSQQGNDITLVIPNAGVTSGAIDAFVDEGGYPLVIWQENPGQFGPSARSLLYWSLIWYSDAAALFHSSDQQCQLMTMCEMADIKTRIATFA